jgi:hypothetical protein
MFVGFHIFVTALGCSSITPLSCPLSNLPSLSISETEVLSVKEVKQILYRLLIPC